MAKSDKLKENLLPVTSPDSTSEVKTVNQAPRSVDVAAASASTETNPWASFVNGFSSGASNLANLLPTGTFLAFTAIAPVVTDQGTCDDKFEYFTSIAVVVFFGLFCFFSSFTDSYEAADKKVYFGLVTINGLWTPQLPEVLHPGDKQQYKLGWTDIIHATLSLAVFAACALMTATIRTCFYPNIPQNVVRIVPALVGFFVSAVFVTFPTKRHGVGFPVSPTALFTTSTARDYSAEVVTKDFAAGRCNCTCSPCANCTSKISTETD